LESQQIIGYHSEWNLGSPGGWDYQRMAQQIGKAVWTRVAAGQQLDVDLDFDLPLLSPVGGFADLLVRACRQKEGRNASLVAVVAEEETLADVVENRNLAQRLDSVEGLSGALMAPQELALEKGRVSYRGTPVGMIFMDFNTDVLLALHRKHGLEPLLEAVRQGRVINPRGTEPINAKGMFEVLTDPDRNQPFHAGTVARTPWTRRFFDRATRGPQGEPVSDLIEWTRQNWPNLVLKPERGYSGRGVRVGGVHPDADAAIEEALKQGDYIVQQKVPLHLWAEDIPQYDDEKEAVELVSYQTDFRCLFGPGETFGFVSRYGTVPTNVGSGGGFQPLAVLRSPLSVAEATARINDAIMAMGADGIREVVEKQRAMALDFQFTYLLGPVKIAMRPRLVTPAQIDELDTYCARIWEDCLVLEKMWHDGLLDDMISIEAEELDIARSQPWQGSPAIFASDGIFSFGAHRGH
jgi:hypothetical protein